jgi:predicted phosphodiesterase
MLRVISDLHLYDGACRIRQIDQLGRLLEGVSHLVINGDSCDTEIGTRPEQVAEMQAYFAARVPQVTYITGNHDPTISEHHELLLADGRIWLTHGDVFFDTATPWSRLLPELRRRIAAAVAHHSAGSFDRVETRLQVFRKIVRQLPIEWDLQDRHPLRLLRRLLVDMGSPRRVWAVWEAWQNSPRRAADVAQAQRGAAHIVLFGHIHCPSVTQHGSRTIINTGSFTGPFGATCVDWIDDRLVVRPVQLRSRLFRPGPVRREIPLALSTPARFTGS